MCELSIVYLYRLVSLEQSICENSEKGAYGSIIINPNNTITKRPMNYAAFCFAMKTEYEMYQMIENTLLFDDVPQVISYDKEKKWIVRSYIEGKTGHQLLVKRKMNTKKISKLKQLFFRIRKVENDLNIFFDIHPANFVWNEQMEKWFFVDLGIVPYIGHDYYPNNFELYYKKIWEERLERMEKIPIRSVYL